MSRQHKSGVSRSEMSFIFALAIGLVIGILIKKVKVGILLGVLLGTLIVFTSWLRIKRK